MLSQANKRYPWPLLKVFVLGQEASSGLQVLALIEKTVQDGLPSPFKKP